jgi:CheY-like chemotaxis protein
MVVAAENAPLRGLVGQLGDAVSVQFFDSANDALWEVRSNPPEALLAELDLPGMTGLELAEILPNFELPTRIVLYSPTDDAARSDAEAAGVFKFLFGPLTLDELRSTLDAAASAAAEVAAAVPEPEPEPEPLPPPEPRRPMLRAPRPVERPVRPARPAPPPPPPPEPVEGKPYERRDFTPARVVLPSRAEREAAAAAESAAASSSTSSSAAASSSTSSSAAASSSTSSSAAKGGLAARSKAAASRAPTPPEPAPRSTTIDDEVSPWRGNAGNLVVTEKNVSAIKAVMMQLSKDLGTQSVMLTDRAGMTMVEVGSAPNLPMMIVLPLLSTGFSTTGEVARQLREEHATSVYIHEGVNVDLYCFDVMQRFLLVLVFDKQVISQRSKIGAVWLSGKRAIRELREAF